MNQPKVSILVPIYNTAKYLPTCLDSLMKQTLKEIEIIAVNDASPDNAAEVLAEYAKKDPRIKIVTHEKNGGILAARISGIKAAKGEYVMVLDADDTLTRDIARAAYDKAKRTGADMVHFEFDVRGADGKKRPFHRDVDKRLAPYHGTLLGERVFEGAFVDRLYRWNICSKLIAHEVFEKAADALPPGYYIMAEDFCFYSLMSFYAKHYEPLLKKGYNYVLDIGVSAYVATDRKGFERSCSVFTALNAVRGFLEENGVFQKYEDAFRVQERLLLCDLFDRWEHRLPAGERPAALQYMLDHYEPNALVAAMAETFHTTSAMEICAMHLGRPAQLTKSGLKRPEKIAVYLDRITDSDTAVQLIAAAKTWTGLKPVIVSPEKADIRDLPFLPFPGKALADASPKENADRINGWKKLLAENDFDAVLYAEPGTGDMIWDILAIKAEGKDVIVVPARSFDLQFNGRTGRFTGRATAFRFADAVACFSKNEAEIHNFRGTRSTVVPAIPQTINRSNGRDIVWMGNPGDMRAHGLIMSAFAKGTEKDHDPKLILCTPDLPAETERNFHQSAEMFNIADRCSVVCGLDRVSGLLAGAALLVTENQASRSEIAARHAFYDFKAVLPADTDQETLAESIRAILNCEKEQNVSSAECGTWDELFDSLAKPAPCPDPHAAIYEQTLRGCYESSVQFERYALEPPRDGDTFFTFYQFFDKMLEKWFPAGTKKRHVLFSGTRKVMRKLFHKD